MDSAKIRGGQSSLEFLVTSGLVVLVITIAVVVVWQTGVLRPASCDKFKTAFSQVVPVDWAAYSGSNVLVLRVENRAGYAVNVTDASADVGDVMCVSALGEVMEPGDGAHIILNCSGTLPLSDKYLTGDCYKADVELRYVNMGTGDSHESRGGIRGAIEEGVVTTTSTSTTSTLPGPQAYRRQITLSSATSLANYQVLVILDTGTLGNPYTHINLDGSDIRFRGSDAITLQDYWIESWNNAGTSKIWVEVEDSGESMIYMYYGNSSASSASDGDATFDFFDDFLGLSLDGTKWGEVGAVDVSGGAVHLDADDGIFGKSMFGQGYAVMSKAKADEQDVSFVGWAETSADEDNRFEFMNTDAFGTDDVFNNFTMYSSKDGVFDLWHLLGDDFRAVWKIYSAIRVSSDKQIVKQEEHSVEYSGNISLIINLTGNADVVVTTDTSYSMWGDTSRCMEGTWRSVPNASVCPPGCTPCAVTYGCDGLFGCGGACYCPSPCGEAIPPNPYVGINCWDCRPEFFNCPAWVHTGENDRWAGWGRCRDPTDYYYFGINGTPVGCNLHICANTSRSSCGPPLLHICDRAYVDEHTVYAADGLPVILSYKGGCTIACVQCNLTPLGLAQQLDISFVSTVLNATGNKVGLVGYGTGIRSTHPLSNDTVSLNNSILDYRASGETCVCCAIRDAANILAGGDPSRTRHMLFMSDGVANQGCGAPWCASVDENGDAVIDARDDAIHAARKAHDDYNITIYSVGFGRDAGSDTMQRIADCGNGSFYESDDVEELREIYADIAQEMMSVSCISTVNMKPVHRVWSSSQASTLDVDWTAVRKYAFPEPDAVVGAEEAI